MTIKRFAPPLLVTALALAVGASSGKLFTDSDTDHYLALAAGQPTSAPFAARQLAPLLVRALTHLGLPLHAAFWLLGVLSLAFFVAAVSHLLWQNRAATWLGIAVMGLFFPALLFSGMVLPDLFYAALLCGFLLLVRAGRLTFASALLLPLMIARESTALVLLCWLITGWKTLGWGQKLGSVGAVAAGAAIVRSLTTGSGGNREGLTPVLYLLGKIPWNFSKNFLGLEPWANLNPSCGTPAWHHAVALGPLHEVGYCRLEPEYPIRTLAYALATFGLLPLLLWCVRRSPAEGLLVRFSVVYGLLAYAMAGLLGYSVQRLYGYGWPAFLVALPALAASGSWRSLRWVAAFLALHLTASWLEWRVDKLPLLLSELALWAAGAAVLRTGWVRGKARI